VTSDSAKFVCGQPPEAAVITAASDARAARIHMIVSSTVRAATVRAA